MTASELFAIANRAAALSADIRSEAQPREVISVHLGLYWDRPTVQVTPELLSRIHLGTKYTADLDGKASRAKWTFATEPGWVDLVAVRLNYEGDRP